MAKSQIDVKYLVGLKYRSAEEKEVKTDNGPKKKFFPLERPLNPEDVMDWADKGDYVVIVTADGQKYTVSKNPKKDESKKDESKKGDK